MPAADILSFAAAPTFAVMAFVTIAISAGAPNVLCTVDASPLSGMVPMYVLMTAFHSGPWLKLLRGERASAPTE